MSSCVISIQVFSMALESSKEYVEVKLHIDQSVPPVAQRARRIPFHMRKEVAKELNQLEQQGIIEKVDGPTPWCPHW